MVTGGSRTKSRLAKPRGGYKLHGGGGWVSRGYRCPCVLWRGAGVAEGAAQLLPPFAFPLSPRSVLVVGLVLVLVLVLLRWPGLVLVLVLALALAGVLANGANFVFAPFAHSPTPHGLYDSQIVQVRPPHEGEVGAAEAKQLYITRQRRAHWVHGAGDGQLRRHRLHEHHDLVAPPMRTHDGSRLPVMEAVRAI